jgi:hypothetical protein
MLTPRLALLRLKISQISLSNPSGSPLTVAVLSLAAGCAGTDGGTPAAGGTSALGTAGAGGGEA